MKRTLIGLVLGTMILTGSAMGKDSYRDKNMPPFEVGVFVQVETVDKGTVSQRGTSGFFGQRNVRTTSLNYIKAVISTPEGQYLIDPPTSMGVTMLVGDSMDNHKAWFVDKLQEGDTVLFSAKCGKHNTCEIRVPNPDKPGKEIWTTGTFVPAGPAKTNTQSMCGSGKLTPEVEAQVCGTDQQK